MKKLFFAIFSIYSIGLMAQSTVIQPGIVLPQMSTSQRTAMASPIDGMLVFDSNTQSYWFRQSGSWVELPKGGSTSNYWSLAGAVGNEIKNTNSGGFWSSNPSIVNGASPIIAPPTSGSGTRMMWIPAMSAFRAGTVHSNHWDNGNIGKWSTAFGQNTIASGEFSFAAGNVSIASGNGSVAIGSSVTAEHSNSLVLGTTIASGESNQFVAKFTGGYIFYSGTNAYGASGVRVYPNDNSWSSVSDSTKKEKFIASNGEEVLKSISQMRVGTWNYKGQDPKTLRHWGVMAQDFYKYFGKDKFGTVGNDVSIATADFDGVVFAAIKALEERTRNTNTNVAVLKNEFDDLREQNKALEEKIEKLESSFKNSQPRP